jgi:hypothetical protein
MNDFLQALNTRIVSTAATSWYQTLGTRVYLNAAPEDTQLPLCVYRVESHSIEQTFGTSNVARERFVVAFEQYHSTTAGVTAALSASESLATLLDNASLSPINYDRVVLRSETRGVPEVEEHAIRTVSRFRAIGTRTG